VRFDVFLLNPLFWPGAKVLETRVVFMPSGSLIHATDSGWMTQDVFHYWIENGFIPKLAPSADWGHVVLLLDTIIIIV